MSNVGLGPIAYKVLRILAGRARGRMTAGIRDAQGAQAARLKLLLKGVMGTLFEDGHAMRGDEDLHAWREAIPVRTHEDYLPYLERILVGEPRVLTRGRVLSLVESQGTLGAPKVFPVTTPWSETMADAQLLWMLAALRDDPGLADGRMLAQIIPAEQGVSPAGLSIGGTSGRLFLAQPWWLQVRAAVPYAAFCLDDPDVRAYVVLRHAIAQPVTSWTVTNPAVVLDYCQNLTRWWEDLAADCQDGTLVRGPAARLDAPSRALLSHGLRKRMFTFNPSLTDIWPLRRINCWTGGTAALVLPRLAAALGGEVPVREVGISAAEGFFAVPVDEGDPVALLGGHLLEFLDERGEAHWAWEVEEGREYRLVVSTEAGLYRYDLGDVVRVTGFLGEAPRLVFVRKASALLNSTGANVTESQVVQAAQAAFPGVTGFAVTEVDEGVPTLRVAVEGLGDRVLFDLELQRVNEEYRNRREAGWMGPPQLLSLPPGSFGVWRRTRSGGHAGDSVGQDPVVVDPARFDELVRAAGPSVRAG